MKSYVLVTGADANYFHMAQGLILSLLEAAPSPPSLGFLDLGCQPDQIDWLAGHGVEVRAAEWDFDFPGRATTHRRFQAMSARPMLPRYFPDREVLAWMDGDSWVQDWAAVELLLAGARDHGFAVAPEVHPSYSGLSTKSRELRDFLHVGYEAGFGREVADRYATYAVINTGVCAYRPESILRSRWIENLGQAVQRTRHFMVELLSMNLALYSDYDRLYPEHIALLPATCNWMCHQATPLLDERTGFFLAPTPPHERIGILHRTSDALKRRGTIPVRTVQGTVVDSTLEYRGGTYSDDKPMIPQWQDNSDWYS